MKVINKYFHFILFYLMAAFVGGSVLGIFLDISQLCIIVLLISVVILKKQAWKINRDFLWYFMAIVLIVSITCIYTKGALSIQTCCNLVVRFLLVYCIFVFEISDVIDRFIKFAYAISIISIIFCFIGYIIGQSALYSLAPFSINRNIKSFGIYNIVPIHFGQNIGIFGEPGQYQIFLSVALFFAVFYYDEHQKKERLKKIIIIILAIITAQSTAGFICLFGFAIGYIVLSKVSIRYKFLILLASVMLILYTVYIVGQDSGLYYNMIGKIRSTNGIDLAQGSGSDRIDSMHSVISAIKTNPEIIMGIGYDGVEMLNIGRCASLFSTLVVFGIGSWLLIYGSFIYLSFAYANKKVEAILAIYIIIVAGLSQPNFMNPFLIFLIIIPWLSKKENIVRHRSIK